MAQAEGGRRRRLYRANPLEDEICHIAAKSAVNLGNVRETHAQAEQSRREFASPQGQFVIQGSSLLDYATVRSG